MLGGMAIARPKPVRTADIILYLPMARSFLCLVAIMDWYSGYVLN